MKEPSPPFGGDGGCLRRYERSAAIKHQKDQMSDEELKQRNLELERENAELRKANDILKDALGFFAKNRKK